MRHHNLCAVILAVVLGLAWSAEAVDFSVGPKYWLATWENDNFRLQTLDFIVPIGISGTPVDRTFPGQFVDMRETRSTGTGLYGGTFTVSFRKWAITSTFLLGEYDLKLKGGYTGESLEAANVSHESLIDVETSTDRMDVDFAVAYRVFPTFNVFAGFKYISYEYSTQFITVNSNIIGTSPSFTLPRPENQVAIEGINPTFMGPAFGFSGSASLGKHWFSYGSLSVIPYLVGDDETEKLTGDDAGWATNVEVGFGLFFPKAHLAPTVSYRWQQFAGFGELKDTFSGVTANLSVTF